MLWMLNIKASIVLQLTAHSTYNILFVIVNIYIV